MMLLKKAIKLFSILAFYIVCMISCKKEKKTDDENKGNKYILTVNIAEGIWHFPSNGTHEYENIDTVTYYCSLKEGYSNLSVTINGINVPDSGSIIMNKNHTLRATCDRRVLWKLELNKHVYYSCPAVGSDGTIYISTGIYHGTDWGSVYAVNSDGEILWTYDCEANTYSPVIGENGNVIVQDYQNNVYSLSPSGVLQWKFNSFECASHPIYEVGQRNPAIGADGTIYIAADGLYALNPSTGTRIWRFNPTSCWSCRQSPVVASDGTIYFFLHQHDFYAVNPNGTEKWHAQLDNAWEMSFASPAIDDDGTIYIGAENGSSQGWVYAFSSNGTKKWKYTVEGEYRVVRASPIIGDDGTIYIATKAGYDTPPKLIALNSDGTSKWEYLVDENTGRADDIYSTPSIGADGVLYFGAETGYLYAVNSIGTLAWKVAVEGGINWSSPAITSNGILYIGAHNENEGEKGVLYAIQTSSMGYAFSPWPKFRRNNKNNGRY